jgi:hypothetical protein
MKGANDLEPLIFQGTIKLIYFMSIVAHALRYKEPEQIFINTLLCSN